LRALLVYNPNATTTTPAVIDVIAAALGRELKLDVEATKRRHHASYLAAGAVHEGFDVVFALGGDGTMNEVLQGVAGTPARLGIIPGGSTNVWARTLGLPNDAIEATSVLLGKLANREERTVSLGRANGRFFGFNCGFGFDAEAVRFVERRYRLKRTVRQASFLYCGFLAYFRGFDRKTEIRATVDGVEHDEILRTAICCNSSPYSYLGPMEARLCPDADIEGGLDLFGVTSMSLPRMLRLLRTVLRTPEVDALPFTRLWHDHDDIVLRADRSLPIQLDGDFAGETSELRIDLVERGVTVIA
jgi:diacylglycerol kinase family enzyme